LTDLRGTGRARDVVDPVRVVRAAFRDFTVGGRFLAALPRFLRRPLTLPEARAVVARRREGRAADFLELVRTAVYAEPRNPYHHLLRHAGCTYGDLRRLVEREGLEAGLQTLAREGVYLAGEELKGRRPLRRGSLSLEVEPEQLRNPGARAHLLLSSGGSRGPASPVAVDLAFMRETNANHRCALEARGGTGWAHGVWDVPGGAAIIRLLRLAGIGAPPVRWFSQIDPRAASLHPRYRWSARALRWGSVAAGAPLPAPVHVPVADPWPIARWMAEVLAAGRAPHLVTTVSAALRLVQCAGAAGVALTGAQLTVSGEPVTELRVARLRRSGAQVVPTYGSSDTGTTIAHGCLAPARADDMHVFDDLFALIQPAAGPGVPARTLLFTTLRATAPMVLINAALGDQGTVTRRVCGCPLEAFGWATHLEAVRSVEKLTVGGMSLQDVDLVALLDEVLPARFGGGPTHYQLIEDEAEDGRPRLRLLVDPAVGPVDPEAVAEVFLAEVARDRGIGRITGLTWRGGGFLRVERRVPESRRGDKILHLLPRATEAPVDARSRRERGP
jgi:hypothetical protein